jgi:hypothetical protein
MQLSFPAPTAGWPLDAVVDHLAQQPSVDGLMQIGSLAAGTFNAASDIDLAIVLDDAPAPWSAGVTRIDGRFTDLLFLTPTALEQAAALAQPAPLGDPLAPIIRWLQAGQILYDRSGRLARAQAHLAGGAWIGPVTDDEIFGAWFQTNYNLAQARRSLTSPDPLYGLAVDIRMAIHGHLEVWYSYFTVRGIPDTGEKDALRYLQAHDPDFLRQYRRFIGETERQAKFALYEQMAAMALAPFGPIWSADTTAATGEGMLGRWAELIGALPQ